MVAVQTVSCALCGLSTAHPIRDEQGAQYCCPACREVSALLKDTPTNAATETAPENAALTLELSGLWCSSCAWLIRERLLRAKGVAGAETHLIQRQARIRYDPGKTNPSQLIKLIRRLGYGASLEGQQPGGEEEALWLRLLGGGTVAMKVMIISFIIYIRRWFGLASPETAWLTEFFEIAMIPLTLIVLIVLGWPIFRAGAAAMLQGKPNTHALIALGSLAAFALSIRNIIAGGDVYFDTTVVLLLLMTVGRWLELRTQQDSQQRLAELWQRIPLEATQLLDSGERRLPADQVPAGACVLVRPGETIPVDGLIRKGRADIDESWLTGEPEPMLRQSGDKVLAGTINLDGSLEIVTIAVGAQSVAGQVGKLLHEAAWLQAPVQRVADRLANWMMPIAITLAIITLTVWSLVRDIETGLVIALSVLLIACPCALGIATPLALWLGLGEAARSGVVLRRTSVLETLAGIKHVYFDKTGTLTKRPLQVTRTYLYEADPELWQLVDRIEHLSQHPLAEAICAFTSRPDPTADDISVTEFKNHPGLGVSALANGHHIWIGSQALMTTNGLQLDRSVEQRARGWQHKGLRVVFVALDGQVRGLLGLAEQLRADVPALLDRLQALRLTVTILTGDSAGHWAEKLGADVVGQLLPDEKLHHIRDRQQPSLMVGDGINDSPALAGAAVGLAVRQGTEIAQTAADGLLLHNDLTIIPWLIGLARQTMRIVQQNLAWAFGYNLVGIILAASGLLQPSIAALLMVGSNLIVTKNALRLRRWELPNHVKREFDLHAPSLTAISGEDMDRHRAAVGSLDGS